MQNTEDHHRPHLSESTQKVDSIHDYARRYGTTEAESRVLYHLNQAFVELVNLPDIDDSSRATFDILHEQLFNIIAVRVASKDHPQGWHRFEHLP